MKEYNDKPADKSILAIYESPNKYKQFKRLFYSLGISVTLCFTQGRVFDIPKDEIGIETKGQMKLVAVDEKRLQHIIRQVQTHDIVFCLTDMDEEGEWIADSIKRLSFEHSNGTLFLRLRLNEITAPSLKSAIKDASEELNLDAISKAQARRYIDRYIGYAENAKKMDIRGRILTPFLNSIYSKNIPKNNIFYIEQEDVSVQLVSALKADEIHEIFNKIKNDLKTDSTSKRDSLNTLPNTAECLLYQMSRLEKASASDSFDELQELYQEGNVSYPRTDSAKYHVMDGHHSGIKALDYDEDTDSDDSLLGFIKNRTIFAQSHSEITALLLPQSLETSLSKLGVHNVKVYKKSNTSSRASDSFYKPLSTFTDKREAQHIGNIKVERIELTKHQLLLMRLIELNIAQPSTLHMHVDKAARYTNFEDALTLSVQGLRIALQSDRITNAIKNVDNVYKINNMLDKNGVKVEEKILECLNIINQGAAAPEEKDLSL